MKMMKKKISELKPHPKNEEIYGYDEDCSDLVEKIRRSKDVHTLTINSDGVILAGHRRRKACMQLGIKEVNVEVRDFITDEEELEFIIDNNSTREKTSEQKTREAKSLKEIESVLAEKRMTSGENQYNSPVAEPPHPSEQGKSRDIVAKKVGFKSGREVDRAIKTVAIIDELEQNGENAKADLVRGVLNNRSVSTAEEFAKHINEVEIPEDEVELIKTGKKSPYTYVEKIKEQKKSKIDTKKCTACGEEFPLNFFYEGKNQCKNCCDKKERERKSGRFKDALGNTIEYDKSLVNSKVFENVVAFMKRDSTKDDKTVNHEMELQLFQINLNDFFFANKKFIDGAVFENISSENREKFKVEIERLSIFVKILEENTDLN